MKRFIFGLGTGRCGSHALATLLNMQKGFEITHEGFRFPWNQNLIKLGKALALIEQYNAEIVGNVASWYLPYIEYIIKEIGNVWFVCLKRNRDDTVKSFLNKVPKSNHWTSPESKFWTEFDKVNPHWQLLYPKYDAPKKEAIETYWGEYYRTAEIFADRYPNFRIFDMDRVLNTEEGQREVLSFVGIGHNDMILQVGLKTNEGRHN